MLEPIDIEILAEPISTERITTESGYEALVLVHKVNNGFSPVIATPDGSKYLAWLYRSLETVDQALECGRNYAQRNLSRLYEI